MMNPQKRADFKVIYRVWMIKHAIQSFKKALQVHAIWAYLLCLWVLSHVKLCVLMHGCQCMYLLLSVICLEERMSQCEPQWAVWDPDKGLLYLWDGVFYRLKAEIRSDEA